MKTSVFDTPAPLLSKNEAGKIALKYYDRKSNVSKMINIYKNLAKQYSLNGET